MVQHVEYIPFGVVFIEERNSQWNTPYLFNGKELDEQTGLYYYGARYYNPRESIWLGVDPLADKYPGVTPYAYTLNNPVRYIDPFGLDEYEVNATGHVKKVNSNVKSADYIYRTDAEGSRIDGQVLELPQGSFSFQENRYPNAVADNFNPEITSDKWTTISLSGDELGTKVFEFLASYDVDINGDRVNTVEYGLSRQGKDESGPNTIISSHLPSRVRPPSIYTDNAREYIHNHPSNRDIPSPSDKRSAQGRDNTKFYIYTQRFGYTQFNSNGIVKSNYGPANNNNSQLKYNKPSIRY